MCSNCAPYRENRAASIHYSHHASLSASSETHEPRTTNNEQRTSTDQRRINRGELLKAVGGGLALALTGSMLGWGAIEAAKATFRSLVLIILDGARPEYFDIPGIPNVKKLIRSGTQFTNAFAGILESETPSGHTTIATGSEPRSTGIPSFWWANNDNIQIDLFDPVKIRAGDMEAIIRKSGVPTLAGLVHRQDPRARVVALSGSKYYAADALGGPDADVIMYFTGDSTGQFVPTYIPGHAPPAGLTSSSGLSIKDSHMPLGAENHLVMKLAIDTFGRVRQRVTLINLPEFDWPLGHVDGGIRDPQGIKTLMQQFDRDLGAMQDAYRKAGVLDRTLFVLAADHGMMPLVNEVPKTAITDAVAKAGATLISEAYTTGSYLWIKEPSLVLQSARNITNLQNPHVQSVYARTSTSKGFTYQRVSNAKLLKTVGTESANQYLLRSFNNSNAPDVVVLFAEGTGSEPGGQANWKADHGGASWQAQHMPLILSGPGIRAGHTSSYPARLIDIAPTALSVLGASYAGMQGIPLADAMLSSSSSAQARQRTVGAALSPLVSSLQKESQLEVKAA
jgi:Type I phosphodiesterase / nucleotide pyrophosphatase